MKKFILFGLAFLFIFIIIMDLALTQAILLTCFGWYYFPKYHLPLIEWHGGIIFLVLILLLLFVTALHLFAIKNLPKWNLPKWKLRWTASLFLLIIMIFSAGISIIGIVHQLHWLSTTEAVLYQTTGLKMYQELSKDNLVNIGKAALKYQEDHESLPTYGFNPETILYPSSWETKLLPFLGDHYLYEKIDFSVPWDHPKNKESFQSYGTSFMSYNYYLPYKDKNNYGLSHYSANKLLYAKSDGFHTRNITDGTTQTIMFGEVVANLKPWGKPGNWRDPGLGLSSPKKGFMGSFYNGTHFTFADGSVKHISNDIDPKILKALSTPNGGEDVIDF